MPTPCAVGKSPFELHFNRTIQSVLDIYSEIKHLLITSQFEDNDADDGDDDGDTNATQLLLSTIIFRKHREINHKNG